MKKPITLLLIVLLAAFLGTCLFACRPVSKATPTPQPTATPIPTSTPTPTPPRNFDGERAYQQVLKQVGFGFRPTGSEAGWATGDWIIQELEQLNWMVETQEFAYQGITARNIIGKMPVDPEKPVVILGAHYDTRLRADQDPVNPTAPVMGANDGASGTAVLLELAFALEPDKITYQVWLAFFDAEDNGQLDGWDWIVGSSYMANHLEIQPEFVIVVDMIGDADQQVFYERNSDTALMERIWQTAGELGYSDTIVPEYRYSMLDDHTPFAHIGIPAVDMIDFDYPYWHTTADTADKVSAESLMRVGHTVETFLESGNGDGHE